VFAAEVARGSAGFPGFAPAALRPE